MQIPGQFNITYGIAIDSNDNVYVADKNNSRIQVFDDNGTFIKILGTKARPTANFCVRKILILIRQTIFMLPILETIVFKSSIEMVFL